jgi:transcriptional regulator with XRE-family HTH domain
MAANSVDQTTLAAAAGYNKSIVSNWLADKTGQPKLDSVRRTATALNVSVAEALVAAEYINEDDLQNTRLPADIQAIDTAELLREISSRLGYRTSIEASGEGTTTVDATVLQGRWGDSSVPPPSIDAHGVAADADDE